MACAISSSQAQSNAQDSITFSRSHAEYMAMAMIERDHLKQKIIQLDSSRYSLRLAIEARTEELRKCEIQRSKDAEIIALWEIHDDACAQEVQSWKVQAKRNKRTGLFLGVGGVAIGLITVFALR